MRGSRTAQVRAQVNALRVRELQAVLADMNLSRSGRKQELIDRIVTALEQLETKATENASNHATAAFYNEQLSTGLRSLQTHAAAARASSSSAAPMASSGSASSAPASSTPRTPPPVVYGRPIPFNAGHHQRPQPTHHHLVPPPPPPLGGANTHATEVLHATTPVALDGARCFCTNTGGAVSGKVVACVECQLRVHAKCHQLVNSPVSDKNDWYCETCRAALCDPFLQVKKTVLAPVFVKFNRQHATQRIEYTITDQDINDIYSHHKSPGSMKPGSLELQLRCFILKEELGTGTSWPTTSVIAANGFGLQLVQRAPPGQTNPSKVLREQPADLFPYSRVGRNVIEVRTGEQPVVFCFVVQIVEFRDISDIVNEVRAASQSITYEDAKKNVIKSFGGGDDDDDDDDAVVATSTVLSLRCPLGLCMIDLPARGVHCKHLQCFDLKTFLTFNKKARSRHYRCTVCHNFIKAADLRIDPYLKQLLREVQGEDELEEVEILPDASWKRRLGDDAEATPPPKRLKLEAAEAVAATAAAATTTVPAGSNDAGSAAAPFEIDLSLSSDEDDDDALSAIPTLTATTGTPSSVSATTSTANLSDDDVAIFTVDSDVWDLPPTGGSGTGHANGGGSGDVPFPIDIFTAFGTNGGGNHVDLSSTNSNWAAASAAATSFNTLPSLTATTATGTGYAATAPAWTASGSVTANAASARGTETGLANAMAQLSRNHPHVNNPFDARHSVTVAPKPSVAASGAGGSGGGGGSRDDVICLLDSDSE